MQSIYIGIDGGGTHTTAVAVRPDGTVIGRAEGDGLNYHNDGLEVCLVRFRNIVNALLSPLGESQARVCAGLAALDGPAEPGILTAFQRAVPPGCTVDLRSDAYIALMGHTEGRPGLMIICGTGSMLLALDAQGEEHVAGGWGWKFHDAGSGYSLARVGLMRALDTWEQQDALSPLLKSALAFFDVSAPRALIDRIYAPGFAPERLAGWGAEVIRLAEAGDAQAQAVLETEMDRLARQAAALLCRVPEARLVGLYGGVFQHSARARACFTGLLTARCPDADVSAPRCTPPLGAVIHSMIQSGVAREALPVFKEEQT